MDVIGRNLYVVGGVGPRPRTVMVYDTKTRQWDTSLPPLPSRREHLAVSVLNGHLVVIAGRWRRDGNFSVVEALNVKSKEWLRLPDLPARRGGFSGATVGGRIHVTGGEALGSFTTYAEHWAYDPAQNKWLTMPPMSGPRHGIDSVAIGKRWYVLGGASGAGRRTGRTLTGKVEIFEAVE